MVEVFDSYHLAVPVVQVAESEAVAPLQIVCPAAVGVFGKLFTVTICEILALTQLGVPPDSQATK